MMEAYINSMKISFTQDEDTCGRAGFSEQELEVELQDVSLRGDPAYYIVLKTDRWALDESEIDAFADKLKSLIKTANNLGKSL